MPTVTAIPPNATGPFRVRIHEANTGKGRISGRRMAIIRGELLPEFFAAIIVPSYQREPIRHHKHKELMEALDPDEGIGIPDDLLLCLRKEDFEFRAVGVDTIDITIRTGLVLLDGHQRWFSAMKRLRQRQSTIPFGVKILLDTTLVEEIDLFYQVNRLQTKVSPQVLLRNSATTVEMETLKRLFDENPDLPRVSWDHASGEGPKITARMLYEVAVMLHGGSRFENGDIEEVRDKLSAAGEAFGTDQLTKNVETFFRVLHDCFGDSARKHLMLRADLLRALSKVFSAHTDFWRGNTFFVAGKDVRKLEKVRAELIWDDLRRTSATNTLYETFVKRINTGRTGGKLKPRDES